MKHTLEDDVNININLPKQDLVELIDKITDSAITIIAAATVGHIFKSILKRKGQ